jgi:hypothetical protein
MPDAFIIEMSKLKVPREYQSHLPNHTGADAVYPIRLRGRAIRL